MLFHYDLKITGRVQGVFYRHLAKREAEKLGIKGFIRNEPDGSVFIEAEGDEEKLKKFLDWCRQGPSLAKVEKVKVNKGEIKSYEGFEVL